MIRYVGTNGDRPAWAADKGTALIAVLDREGRDVPADKLRLDKAEWKKEGSWSHYEAVTLRAVPGSVAVLMEHSPHTHGADGVGVYAIEGGERLAWCSVRRADRPVLEGLSETLRDAVIDRIIASHPDADERATLAYRWAKSHEDGLV